MDWTREKKMKTEIAGNVIDILLNYRRDQVSGDLTPIREEQLVNAAIGGLKFLQGMIIGGGVKLAGEGETSAD